MEKELVWYYSYGSNLHRSRFLCYINGGTPEGSLRSEKGCKDGNQPIKDRGKTLRREIHFSGKSSRWNHKGVAAISPIEDSTALTYGRMYLITLDQFIDVVKQENHIGTEEELAIAFPNEKTPESIVFPEHRYGKLLYLGEDEGYPIYSFTIIEDFYEAEIVPPDPSYIRVIQKGLEEAHRFSLWESEKYFIQLQGIKGFYQREAIRKIIRGEVNE